LLLVPPLAVIHDAADGRAGGGGDLNQVQTGLASASERLGGGRRTDFDVSLVNQKDRRDPDLLVVTEIGVNGACLLQNLSFTRVHGQLILLPARRTSHRAAREATFASTSNNTHPLLQ
jgi:hypothetical protein